MLMAAIYPLIALTGTPAPAAPEASPYAMMVTVSDYQRETVFLSSPASGETALPVFRICYDSAVHAAPQSLSVHVGERYQLLSPGGCRFFSGDRIDLAVWKADGTIRASVTLLR